MSIDDGPHYHKIEIEGDSYIPIKGLSRYKVPIVLIVYVKRLVDKTTSNLEVSVFLQVPQLKTPFLL